MRAHTLTISKPTDPDAPNVGLDDRAYALTCPVLTDDCRHPDPNLADKCWPTSLAAGGDIGELENLASAHALDYGDHVVVVTLVDGWIDHADLATDATYPGQIMVAADPRSAPAYPPTVRVLAEVAAERARQDAKWGEQNHPLGTLAEFGPLVDQVRKLVDASTAAGTKTWAGIALEEFVEAFAEHKDPAAARAELVQVCAVFAGAIESIDRAGSPPPRQTPTYLPGDISRFTSADVAGLVGQTLILHHAPGINVQGRCLSAALLPTTRDRRLSIHIEGQASPFHGLDSRRTTIMVVPKRPDQEG